jgi:ATP-binding cassette subfamily B protein
MVNHAKMISRMSKSEEIIVRYLLPYLKEYKKESVIGPLFKLFEATLELIVPLIMAQMIDVGIKNRDLPYILRMGGVLILFGMLGLTCSLVAQYYAAKAAVGFGSGVRHALFAHIQKLSYAEIDQVGSATLVVRMTSDINQVQSGVNLVLRLFLRSPFIVVGAMIMSWFIDGKLACIFVIVVPLLAFVIYGIMMLTIPLYQRVQKGLDRVLCSVRENLRGIRVVRACCTQQEECQAFTEQVNTLFERQVRVGNVSALLNPLTYVIVNLGIVAIVWYGGGAVDTGRIQQGEVIALVNYMTQILLALVALANLIVSFTKALASAKRVQEVFEITPSIIEDTTQQVGTQDVAKPLLANTQREKCATNNQPNPHLAVKFDHVTFTYPGSSQAALYDIDFEVEKGQTIGIIGGTGSGKSTLVQLIGRFYDTTQGEVLVDGTSVKDWNLTKLREKLAMVLQKAVLFQGTIRENLQMGKEGATDEQLWKALEVAQAAEIVRRKPGELDCVVQEGGKNLSGGQKQRLTIARALVKEPEILILDDSASALDYATDAALREALQEGGSERTTFIVSQRANAIMHANQILVLDEGRLVGKGTHAQLLRTCQVYQEICTIQKCTQEALS